jgi:hypothetical protein
VTPVPRFSQLPSRFGKNILPQRIALWRKMLSGNRQALAARIADNARDECIIELD